MGIQITALQATEYYGDYIKELRSRPPKDQPSHIAWRAYQDILYDPTLDDPIEGYNFEERQRRLDALRTSIGKAAWDEIKENEEINRESYPPLVKQYYLMRDYLNENYWIIGTTIARQSNYAQQYRVYMSAKTSYRRQQIERNYGRGFTRMLERIGTQRERARARNPLLDSLLVQWYGYAPKNRRNKRQKPGESIDR